MGDGEAAMPGGDATNTMRFTRKRWIDLFADYQARIEIVYLELPQAMIRAQNRRRPSPVPDEVIDLIDKLEPPTPTESHALIHSDGDRI